MTMLFLPAAACLLHAWYLSRAVMPAQDAVDVVSVAQAVERDGLGAAIRNEPVPPLFPALVAATHRLAGTAGLIEPRNWATPPQWVAAAALVLALFPVFLLSERLAGRTAAIAATAAFIVVPVIARLGGDGLGDAVHLCLLAWGVWAYVAQRPTIAGLCIAAALWVRIEAAAVPLTIAALALMRPAFRSPRFFVATSLCLVPYLAAGVTSPTEIAQRLRGGAAPTERTPLNGLVTDATTDFHDDPTFGRKDSARSSRIRGLANVLHEYGTELLQAFGFVLLPAVVIGAVSRRRSAAWSDADRLLLATAALLLVILLVMTWRGGYLSTRHFILPVLLTLPYAAIGLEVAARRAAQNLGGRYSISDRHLQAAATAAFVVAALVVTARPLHESQRPHREAAAWLDAAERRPGAVLDQQALTALFTGRTTYRFDDSAAALADPTLAYVVVERIDLEADTPRGAALRDAFGGADRAEAVFAADRRRRERDVLVFLRPKPLIASRESNSAR